MNPDGTDRQRLTNLSGDEKRPVMSPDGTHVRQLTYGPGHELDSGLAWTPDSRQTLFRSIRSGEDAQLWRINVDGSGLTQLTWFTGGGHDPAFSPDGRQIAFSIGVDY
jgi:TolB protein